MDYKRVRATSAVLDPQNPRLPDGTASDRDAVNRLLDDGFEALMALARDLVAQGESNPTELPIAIKEGAKYLILEGNRRFAALKLLKDPQLADQESHAAAFKRVASKASIPTAVMTAIAESREEADHWIVLRHTGPNNGVGVKRWSPEQTALHRKRANASIDSGTRRSMTIADELEEAFVLDPALVDLVKKVRNTKLTNIGRFFASDVMQEMHFATVQSPGLRIRDQILTVRHTANELHGFFSWAIQLIDQNSVDVFKNPALRTKILEEVPDLIPSDSTMTSDPIRLSDVPYIPAGHTPPSGTREEAPGSDSDGSASDSSKPDGNLGVDNGDGADSPGDEEGGNAGRAGDTGVKSTKKSEAKPEKCLFQDLKLPHLSKRLQFLLKEARGLDMSASPGMSCVMARVIVELAVSDPRVLALSAAKESQTLTKKIKACLLILDDKIYDPMNRKPELAQAWLEAENDGLGVQYLHQFVHNPTVTPDHHLARRFSATFRPMLEALDVKLAGQS